ncbi:peptidoglycan D,D-transpeptidase FtsI family protein [Actinoplanes friuliensis]|uniref:Putative penicillin-binding protein n=1 Tax=Actinoplanes friuliensis DSM 7358 TaxID=1246995 RepID=U5VXA0_9ACTN|nr:penicillin-binding protein 2 [Actinoplanes friuliensis]AGZ40286.1 putative penicillin-binding protein [Actinoplanes friuliensis DSM 7358]
MSPRSDETPRRGQEPRRGASRDLPSAEGSGRDDDRARGFGGIGDARAYTPRGRTVREGDQRTRSPRTGRNTDPFRPALQVLDGGRPARDRRREAEEEPPPPQRRGRDKQDREPRARNSRGVTAPAPQDDDEWDDAPRRGGRTTAGAARSRSTANPRRGAAATRTEASARIARERKVAVPAGPRRTPVARPGRPAPPARPVSRRPAPAVPAEPPKLANSTRRLRLGTVLALALFVTIGVRLVVLQVVETPASAHSLLEQRKSRLTDVTLPAPRGSILDRSGAVLAHSVEARYIYADPELVNDAPGTAAKLSPLLGIAPSRLMQLMAKKKRPGGGASRFEYLARGVDIAVADRIAGMNLAGISSDRDERRDVPGADLAANLIGFTGEDHSGLEGLEARYDDLLRGTDGKRVFERGNPDVQKGMLAKEIPGGYSSFQPAKPGSSIQLTIERDLQYEVQGILSRQMEKVDATIGAAVVIDTHTGEVLAQASYPAYNAAKPFDFKPTEREDVASSVIADPGSTHKAFTIGAALQEGVITPDSTVTVGPGLILGGEPFSDTHRFPAGTKLTIPGVLAYSSNIGTIRIAQKLGKEKLYEYQRRFGLGQATNEGMPGEATGRLLAPDEWSGSAWGSVPIGMSVDATLIQMAAGYAAIANDGVYIQPRLIQATISGKDGKVIPTPAPETHEVLSPEVAAQLRTMMESVVDAKGGTGARAAVDGYRISGKTGTGKMLVEGRYTKHNAGSFIGMAPADNPRFVIGVFADVADGTGGDVAAPAFSQMMASALRHFKVPPSGTEPQTFKLKQ